MPARLQMARYATAVALEVPPDEGTAPTWIQVAQQGDFKGHPEGEFQLDAAVFDEIVRNFRAHPSFRMGPDGRGMARVIPFDFKHASEQPAAAIAKTGAPAQAWAVDLERRLGPNGQAQLWSLTDWLEPLRTDVREGRYQWTSVALWPHTLHPVTRQDIGWYLSSIAITNDPFIQGMVPIAAERGGRRLLLEADGLEHVVRELRWMLGLGELAGTPEITAELVKLLAALAAAAAPPPAVGQDMGSMMSSRSQAAPSGLELLQSTSQNLLPFER